MALVKYTGDDVRRAYGVEMKQGDTHEFTDEQAAHLTRLAEFEVVTDIPLSDVATMYAATAPKEKPKAKRIAKTASKKKK